ncbi:MAG: prepilin peptidase [Candidatus Pacebacteria bacterium]|nr:prepilin peptidase [Candidatus Paceibacterota bacterium]MCF7862553.1 prepilin peptidase [Candidatus Paceibacterota bacterium]
MDTILSIIFLMFGLIIGSFLNVVIYRFNTGRSFGGRSKCMSCHRVLTWKELIPVFSFLWLKGKCKSCESRISIQYPLIEGITGLIFLGLFLRFDYLFFIDSFWFSSVFAFYVVMFCLLVCVSMYDLRHKIIPDTFSLFFGVIAFIGLFLFNGPIFDLHIPTLVDVLSGFMFSVPFALIWFFSKGKWMGLGDAKLALGIGWLLGPDLTLSALMIAFWTGALFGLSMLFFDSKNMKGMKTEVPFGPFMAFGATVAFLLQISFFPFSMIGF